MEASHLFSYRMEEHRSHSSDDEYELYEWWYGVRMTLTNLMASREFRTIVWELRNFHQLSTAIMFAMFFSQKGMIVAVYLQPKKSVITDGYREKCLSEVFDGIFRCFSRSCGSSTTIQLLGFQVHRSLLGKIRPKRLNLTTLLTWSGTFWLLALYKAGRVLDGFQCVQSCRIETNVQFNFTTLKILQLRISSSFSTREQKY